MSDQDDFEFFRHRDRERSLPGHLRANELYTLWCNLTAKFHENKKASYYEIPAEDSYAEVSDNSPMAESMMGHTTVA